LLLCSELPFPSSSDPVVSWFDSLSNNLICSVDLGLLPGDRGHLFTSNKFPCVFTSSLKIGAAPGFSPVLDRCVRGGSVMA
jgi:hypothetical protein